MSTAINLIIKIVPFEMIFLFYHEIAYRFDNYGRYPAYYF